MVTRIDGRLLLSSEAEAEHFEGEPSQTLQGSEIP